MSEVTNNRASFLLGPGESGPAAKAERAIGFVGGERRPGVGASGSTLFGIERRYVLALGLVCCYLLFYTVLFAAGNIDASASLATSLFVGWLAGCVTILYGVRELPQLNFTGARIDVLLAVWGNLGVLVAATLVGGDMRPALLMGVVFGVLYSGLHLSERHVRTVLLVTLVAYLVAVLLRARFVPLSLEFELLCAVGLAVLLLASSLIAREVIQLRLHARSRNRQLAVALRRVEELALRDELTGLYNRRHLLDFVGRAIAARARGGPSFALAYCDLDHFKLVNDKFGHECGDRFLKAFADAALSCVRTNDLVARIGGEEFVLVLLDADDSMASDIVERLRMRTANIRVASAKPDYQITLSAGLAVHLEDDTVDGILRRADGALYQAKEQGRDRLISV